MKRSQPRGFCCPPPMVSATMEDTSCDAP
jgi:hypothetical protein